MHDDTINAAASRYYHVSIRKYILISLLSVVALTTRAQYDPSFSHYWAMEPTFNPAAVGKESKLNLTAAYALSFAGFENSPHTMYVAGDMPFHALNTYHGVGLQLMNDQIGLFTHQRVAAQYALKKNFLGGSLGIGVHAGLLIERFKGSELDPVEPDVEDPALSKTDVNGQALDVGVGLYYLHGPWYVGVSAQHLTAPTVELGETSEMQVDPTYYFTAGYNIKLRNPFLTIHPSVLVRTDGVGYRGDITARLQYKHENRRMYLGVAYSPTNSVTALIGGSFHGFNIGYSYEMYTSAISIGNGSHELFVGYQMDINMTKKGKNKHKSVRIL